MEDRKRYFREYTKQRRHGIDKFLQEVKSVPCTDCGEQHPYYVMQFDHCRGTKLFTISQSTSAGHSLDKIKAEIAKCDVVCANCHAKRTFSRLTNASALT